ncbi:bifunctional nicotinamidase/pyrazinamidase [Chryseobacterium vrystaatense]|uniref:nicotinamidase n=1 Tax=Chryseobacterium vrystaatense TaxID=307480 RepID=A0A1M5G8F5_9FLAO|nr:bifunctional nicotinamidase/pyrazinamidase [Chryseobacterium vrystaatense]KFF24944.1 isochorismatase [Chryseobacterium vrystaatense]SHG00025.1 nicotinamidase/pyrazinamidase [Chryseobacterium vrystaatense]
MKALIIIDVQYDFLPGGALAVNHGDEIVQTINELQPTYDLVVATQDWHPRGHKSFFTSHPGKTAFEEITLNGLNQVLWPEHCIQGTKGAELVPELSTDAVEAIFRKGMDKEIDSYSGFFDNGKKKSTGMADYLKGRGVTEVAVCGVAADYCVYYTANDALDLGFKSSIIERASKPIDQERYARVKADFQSKGGTVI